MPRDPAPTPPRPVPQAYRLVKNSIINVEQPDQELQDDEVWDDAQEVQTRLDFTHSQTLK